MNIPDKRPVERAVVRGSAVALGVWALSMYARTVSDSSPLPIYGSGPIVTAIEAPPRNQGLPTYHPSDTSDVYALLLSGSNKERFTKELDALTSYLSRMIPKEHVIILDEGRGYVSYIPNGPADHLTIGKSISLLRDALGPEDGLIVHVGDHGHEIEGRGYITLSSGEMRMDEFADLVKSIPASVFLTTSMCYGGHLAEAVVGEGRTAIASTQPGKESWSTPEASFTRWLYRAFTDKEADINHDFRVSIPEAFSFAQERDEYVKGGMQRPLLKGEDLSWFPSPYVGERVPELQRKKDQLFIDTLLEQK